jgi:hypothetical protein
MHLLAHLLFFSLSPRFIIIYTYACCKFSIINNISEKHNFFLRILLCKIERVFLFFILCTARRGVYFTRDKKQNIVRIFVKKKDFMYFLYNENSYSE